MNFIHIAGHLGADPEVRFTSYGKKVTTLRVAARTRKGQNDDTIWYRVTIWGDQYDKMITYLKKGSAVVVAGEFQKPEIFQDREGKPQISFDITASFVQFSPFGKGGSSSQSQEGGMAQPHAGQPSSGPAPSQFGGFSDTAPNPYMQGYPSESLKGCTHDDEVPF